MIFVTACFAPFAAFAGEAEQKVVRVGWFDSSFCYRDRFGRRCGIDYEYQSRISAYTGWTFEYVEDSWPNLLAMLKEGKIDLLSDVSYTEERTEYMSFPDLLAELNMALAGIQDEDPLFIQKMNEERLYAQE